MLQFATSESDRNKVVSALASVETRSAICRLRRSRLISSADATLAFARLDVEIGRMVVQQLNTRVLQIAGKFVERHNLRALDALQLGSASMARDFLAAPDMRFIASDKELIEAARKEGFDVWDPAASVKGP